MWRNVIIAAAALLGTAVLATGYMELRAPVETTIAEAVEEGDASRMRLCVGPARVTFGGEPFVGLAFGGDGCSANAANLVGFRILRGPTLPPGPSLTLPSFPSL